MSTEDVTSVKVHELSHGVRPDSLPSLDIRFKTLAEHPGAAAINFERLQSVVIRYVLGWDEKSGKPLRHVIPGQTTEGGMLGRCRAWVLANETQARGSIS